MCQFGSKQELRYLYTWNVSKFKEYLVNTKNLLCDLTRNIGKEKRKKVTHFLSFPYITKTHYFEE